MRESYIDTVEGYELVVLRTTDEKGFEVFKPVIRTHLMSCSGFWGLSFQDAKTQCYEMVKEDIKRKKKEEIAFKKMLEEREKEGVEK